MLKQRRVSTGLRSVTRVENYTGLTRNLNHYVKLLSETRRHQQKVDTTMISCRQFMTPLLFFRYLSDLAQPGSRIPGRWYMIYKFRQIFVFYLAKAENRTKKPLTQPPCRWLEKMYIFCLKRRNSC